MEFLLALRVKITGYSHVHLICLYIYFCLATKKHDDKEARGTTSKHSIPDFFNLLLLHNDNVELLARRVVSFQITEHVHLLICLHIYFCLETGALKSQCSLFSGEE